MNSKKLNKFVDVAKSMIELSDCNSRLGACVIYKGKICSTGYNDCKRTNINGVTYPSIHAEMNVIISFINKIRNNKTKKINLLVVRYTKDNIPVISRPCNLCLDFIRSKLCINVKKFIILTIKVNWLTNNLKS